jgi:hypothetical protein
MALAMVLFLSIPSTSALELIPQYSDFRGFIQPGIMYLSFKIKDYKKADSLVHNLKDLASTDLQLMALKPEDLVKNLTAKATSVKELSQKFVELENVPVLDLDAFQTLCPMAENECIKSIKDKLPSISPELTKEVTDSITAVEEFGDFTQVKSLAEESTSESDTVALFYDKIINLAEDFAFDGILKSILEVDS